MITVQQLLDAKPDRVMTIAEDASVQDALESMARHKISALPVVNGSRLAGIVSERDYIRKAVPKRIAPWDITVREIMTRDVYAVERGDSTNACMDFMCANRIRHLPDACPPAFLHSTRSSRESRSLWRSQDLAGASRAGNRVWQALRGAPETGGRD